MLSKSIKTWVIDNLESFNPSIAATKSKNTFLLHLCFSGKAKRLSLGTKPLAKY